MEDSEEAPNQSEREQNESTADEAHSLAKEDRFVAKEVRPIIEDVCPVAKDVRHVVEEVNEDTKVDNWTETTKKLEIFQTELDIVIAQDEDEENEMKNEVILEKMEELKKENDEDQPLVLVKPPTSHSYLLNFTRGGSRGAFANFLHYRPNFDLDDHDAVESFMLELLNELPSLNEGVHVALPKAIDPPFVVDISKGDGIT
ncbi:hypothetical protein Syun_000957 [Stephania yunnanensis]|uniref:Uncharacterized protein n=1 Tax=Stephania yunnanensis TaxID=152371 RepID=A0AAP0Q5T8_9MAGN